MWLSSWPADWFYGKESGTDGVEHFGLTYAFREDAVREDEIVRPSGGGAQVVTAMLCSRHTMPPLQAAI
jgi:hypothetical protein